MSEFEVVRGFSTENGEGRYDYDYLLNKPGRASTEADGLAHNLVATKPLFGEVMESGQRFLFMRRQRNRLRVLCPKMTK